MTDDTLVVEFVASREGDPMVKINGVVSFPDRNGIKPKIAEVWKVEISGQNAKGTVNFLRLIDKIEPELIEGEACYLALQVIPGFYVEGRGYYSVTNPYPYPGGVKYTTGDIWEAEVIEEPDHAGPGRVRLIRYVLDKEEATVNYQRKLYAGLTLAEVLHQIELLGGNSSTFFFDKETARNFFREGYNPFGFLNKETWKHLLFPNEETLLEFLRSNISK